VPLVPDQRPVEQLAATGLHHRSMNAFIPGIWTPLSTISIPTSLSTVPVYRFKNVTTGSDLHVSASRYAAR
jgi:hypothetical protein